MEKNILRAWVIIIYIMTGAKVSWFIYWKSASRTCCRFHMARMKRTGNRSDMEGEVNEEKKNKTWFCRTSFSTSKGEYLTSPEKGNVTSTSLWFIEVMSYRSLFAKPETFPKSCYRQQRWGKGAAWPVPHRSSQGNDMGRNRFISSSLLSLLPALIRKVSKVHRNTWQCLERGTGRQWTECRHSVLLHVWFNEITWLFSHRFTLLLHWHTDNCCHLSKGIWQQPQYFI